MKKVIYLLFLAAGSFAGYAQPEWDPVFYTNSTTAYGVVTINGQPAASSDKVGAFVGEECRAVGNVILYADTAFVTLVINGESVETIGFRVWDADRDTVYKAELNSVSDPGNNIGYPPNYLQIAVKGHSGLPVGIKNTELQPDGNTVLYPNPTLGKVVIEVLDQDYMPLNISVFDAAGRLMEIVANTESCRVVMDLSDYPRGIYYFQISNQQLIRTEKVIKN